MSLIKTKRCILSPLSQKEFSCFVKLQTNTGVRKILGGPVDSQLIKAKFNKYLNKRPPEHHLSVRFLDNSFIGIISLEKCLESSALEVSYQFLPEFWGRGLAYESTSAVIEYAQLYLSPSEIIAETQVKNQSSINLLNKLKMRPTKRLMRFGEEQVIYSSRK